MAGMNSVLDVVGIGVGPANLALAAAVAEYNEKNRDKAVKAVFLESQSSFGWHKDMLLPHAKLQVPFFRDLSTLRTPRSRFTFLNYLKEHGRLDAFINLREFYPLRLEFHEYFTWACENLSDIIKFDAKVISIKPVYHEGKVKYLKCEYIDADNKQQETLARNVVLATGKEPFIPISVMPGSVHDVHTCKSIIATHVSDVSRVIHSSKLLSSLKNLSLSANTHSSSCSDTMKKENISANNSKNKLHFVVAGAGQSAGEIILYLYDHYPSSIITWCFTDYSLKGVDSNPFANREYHQSSVENFFALDDSLKSEALKSLSHSNYAVVDQDLLKVIYEHMYKEGLSQNKRLFLERGLRVVQVTEMQTKATEAKAVATEIKLASIEDERIKKSQGAKSEGINSNMRDESISDALFNSGSLEILCDDKFGGTKKIIDADVLILATGYKNLVHHPLLKVCEEFLEKDEKGSYKVDKNYLVGSREVVGVYLNGYCEFSHGPGDATLSTIASKAQLILESVLFRKVC